MSRGKQDLLDEGEDDVGQLTVNTEYAARFKHNKEREDKHRLQEKQKKGLLPMDDDDSSSEEEDEGAIKPETEVKILDVIKRIRSKDPSIYDPSSDFFSKGKDGDDSDGDDDDDCDDDSEDESAAKKTRRSKPMLLKDVIAKHAIEDAENGGPASDSDDDIAAKGPTYVEEQADLKRAFLDAAGESDEDEEGDGIGGGLKVRSRGGPKRDEEEEPAEAKVKDMLGAVFGEKEAEMDDGDRFLKNFILNKGWVEEGDDDERQGYPEMEEVSDEEEDLDAQETFEHRHNFRYEEAGSTKIATHSRQVEGSIRKKDDRRKRQREAKAERKAAEKGEAADDLKRLKNIKKKELNTKIHKMQSLAGKGASREEQLLMDLLEKDFDPEEYDKQMALAFGDEYYQQGSGAGAEPEENVLDTKAQKEIAEMGYADEDADGEGLAALRERLGFGSGVADWEAAVDGEEGGGGEEAEASAESKAEVMKALEEYYKLDYEQDIGGLKCRFNYKDVDAEDFGMEPEEVLGMDDKSLNDLVGLRVLAPYREDSWRLKKLRYKVQSALGPKRRKDQERFEQHAGKKQEKKLRQAAEKKSQKESKAKRDVEGDDGAKAQRSSSEAKSALKKSKGKSGKGKPAATAGDAGVSGKEKPADAAAAKKEHDRSSRLSSYAVPKLAKPSSGSGGDQSKAGQKKRKAESSAPEANAENAGLTKAQKKNKKRAEMRATKRAKAE